ncbi:MAG: serine/threonine-protein kinase [Gemmatimonas sp.]
MTDDLQNRLQTALGDGYLIERELGGAGMSRVFAATELALQRRVVVKVLPPDLAAGVNHERFRREIQVAAQLQHPHIVPLLAAGESGGLLWFTMPFIEGESLRAAIARKGRFSARDVLRILHDVTDALAYAHARGVVHRDIKPGNILTSGMHALVTDFGVAKALSASTPNGNGGTTTGMAIGTPAYMAPEQLAADPAADHRMDIYAVGLLGYELLTGKSPFSGTSPQATLAAQLTQTPEAPSRSLPDVPVAFSNIIMQCLEKDANKRPPSASALLAELDALPTFGSGETPSHFVRRTRKGPFIAAAAVVVIAAGFVMAQKGAFSAITGNAKPQQKAENGALQGGKGAGANGGGTGNMANTGDTSGGASRAGRSDTVYMYRDTSLTDAQKRTTLPLVITRQDSIAIVNAFRQRKAAEAPSAVAPVPAAMPKSPASAIASSVTSDGKAIIVHKLDGDLSAMSRDSLYAEIARVFSDSIRLAMKQLQLEYARLPQAMRISQQVMENAAGYATPIVAPAPAGTVRIVVQPFATNSGGRNGGGPPPQGAPPASGTASAGGPPGGNPGGNPGNRRQQQMRLGFAFADSLRAGLKPHANLDVVNAELTGKALSNIGFIPNNSNGNVFTNNFVSLGFSLRANYIVTGSLDIRRDSVIVLTQFSDLRGGFSRTTTSSALTSELYQTLPATLATVNAWIDSARVARVTNRNFGRGGLNGRQMEDGSARGPDGRNRDGAGATGNDIVRPPKVPRPPRDTN